MDQTHVEGDLELDQTLFTEEQILAIDKAGDVANCGVTSYSINPDVGRDGELQLRTYNFVAPLEEAGAPVTTRPDPPVAAR